MDLMMYTPEQINLAKQHNLAPAVLLQKVYHWDGSRPTVEELLTGAAASASAEAHEFDDFALAPLLEIAVPGTETNVSECLIQSEEGNAYARALLARFGIRYEDGMLHLNLSHDLLLKSLISPLLREPGARLDTKTGTLVLPFWIA